MIVHFFACVWFYVENCDSVSEVAIFSLKNSSKPQHIFILVAPIKQCKILPLFTAVEFNSFAVPFFILQIENGFLQKIIHVIAKMFFVKNNTISELVIFVFVTPLCLSIMFLRIVGQESSIIEKECLAFPMDQ